MEARAGKERAPGLGISYETASADLIAMNQAFIAADKDAIARIYNERFKIENGAAAAQALNDLLVKWTALTKDVTSGEQLAEIYWNEVFSKVDIATYGK